MTAKLSLALAFLLSLLCSAPASDWPQFLGPTRDGVYPGNDLADSWPAEGPPHLWQKNVGNGFSGPVVADHKLILFHRLDDMEAVDCLEARTGKPLWHFEYPTAYVDDFGFDPGPRATPSIADGFVYTYGAEGMLHCLAADTGKKIWSVDARKQFHALKGFFGIGCSPLVTSNAVLLNIGGDDGAGIVAFDKTNGAVLWKTSNDRASYSSPALASFDGKPCALFLTRNRLTALDPGQGKILFEYKFGPTESSSVTAATPLVIGDLVFVSGCYGAEAMLLQVKAGQPSELWSSRTCSRIITPPVSSMVVFCTASTAGRIQAWNRDRTCAAWNSRPAGSAGRSFPWARPPSPWPAMTCWS